MTWRRAALLVLACTGGADAAADPAVPEPAGYHGEPYRSAVPDTLAGATVLDAAGTADWQARGAMLIDVLPRVRKPAGLPPDMLWREPVHDTIAGAFWLPGTGYDRLSPAVETEFRVALNRLTGGDKAVPLVFFCKADCWMSWNAAKRAVALGHARVGWFPGGTDDWQAEGRALAPATPPQP